MTTTTAPDEFAVLDQLIVRALVTLRSARAACDERGRQEDAGLLSRAEQNLDALLDFRHGVTRRRVRTAPTTPVRAADPLPT
jgi:hypothetical protein